MDKKVETNTDVSYEMYDFSVNPEAPLFVIGVVAEMVQIPIWTLRKLDRLGVVSPQRVGKQTRCYSKKQIQQLRHVYHLMQDRGVTIGNIKVVLQIKEEF